MKTLITICILLVCASAAFAQVPSDVPRDHWAYPAVEQLAGKGLVLGYPDGSFLGNRTLTRYEFATIVARVLRFLSGENDTVKDAPVKPVTTDVAKDYNITKADIDNINKLVDEFKVELTIIGTRLDKVEATVAELKAEVASTKADVDRLKKIKIGGYIQPRYQTINFSNIDIPADQYPDTFIVRRARIKLSAQPTKRTGVYFSFDLGQDSPVVKDTYLQYAFGESIAKSPSFVIGQMNWPFGYEVPYSSGKRETPERALFIRRFFPGERDQGAKVMSGEDNKLFWQLGLYNGTGTMNNSATDRNNNKDLVSNIKMKLGKLDWGFSGYIGRGAWQTFGGAYEPGVSRIRYGSDMQYYWDRLTLKAEYVRGQGVDTAAGSWNQDQWVDGYYTQAGYDFTCADTFVVRYSSMSQDPVKPQYGRRSAWDIGYLRWLDPSTRFKLFYEINTEQFDSFFNNGVAAEFVTNF